MVCFQTHAYPCASLHNAIHEDIIFVQQDIQLHHHWGNNDHYIIFHTVAQTVPLREIRMGLDAKQTSFSTEAEKELKKRRAEVLLPRSSEV